MASESEKICILLKSVGNAPVLKKDKFMLGKTTKLRHIFKNFHGCAFPGSHWITKLIHLVMLKKQITEPVEKYTLIHIKIGSCHLTLIHLFYGISLWTRFPLRNGSK